MNRKASPPRSPGTGSGVATAPDPVVRQAKRDIDDGMVDTDMRATPGLDAELRERLVPGAGGKPPTPEVKHSPALSLRALPGDGGSARARSRSSRPTA